MTLLVEVASLVATLTIPFVLYFVAKKGEVATHKILVGQRQLLEAMRIDDLVAQAESLESRADINLVLEEASTIKDKRKLARVHNAYWKNPAVPLDGFDLPVDERAVEVMRRHLEPKLAGVYRLEALSQLAGFIADAERLGCKPLGGEVSDWVFSRYDDGHALGDGEIRDLLRNVKSPGVFTALLHPLDQIHRRLPDAAVVNVLTGVCLAYLDRIDYFDDRRQTHIDHSGYFLAANEVTWTHEERERDLSEAMLSKLALLLHRDRLIDFAKLDSRGCTIEPVVAYGLVVAVAGATSFADDWQASRSLQGIQRLNIDRDSLGTFDREWCFGRAKFESHQPGPLLRNPIDSPPPSQSDESERPPAGD